MKRIVVLLLLSGCSSISNGNQVSIFGTKLDLKPSCKIEFINDSNKGSYRVPFNNNGECRVVTHKHTDIPKIQYVNGMYVLFIESNTEENNDCRSEYSAVGVNNDGKLFVTDKVKRSSSCHQGKESKSFEYFSSFLKPWS